MRRANGDGTVVKLTGNRRRPYACRKIVGWKEDGRPMIKYISYHRTKREAEKALAAFNEDPYIIANYTLADVYDEWYGQQDGKSENTRRIYRSTWAKLEPISDIKIQNLDRFELQKYFDNKEFSRSSLRQVRILMNMLIEYSVQKGILPISSLNMVKAIKYEAKKATVYNPRTVITKEELADLWAKKDEETVKIILVYIYTGLRYSELFNLLPENAHENYIEIVKSKTEAGKRIVPLSDKVLSLLPIESVPAYSSFRESFHKYLPNHKVHDTRHTFVSMMTEAGVDDRIIKAIVGHKQRDITSIYTHISLDAMLEAVNQI